MELFEDPKYHVKQRTENLQYSFKECFKCKNGFDVSQLPQSGSVLREFFCPACFGVLSSKAVAVLEKFYNWLHIDHKITTINEVRGVLVSVYDTSVHRPTMDALYKAIQYYIGEDVPNTLELAELLEEISEMVDTGDIKKKEDNEKKNTGNDVGK